MKCEQDELTLNLGFSARLATLAPRFLFLRSYGLMAESQHDDL